MRAKTRTQKEFETFGTYKTANIKHSLTPNEKQIKDLHRKLNPKTSRKLTFC